MGVYGFSGGILQTMSGPLSDKIGRKTPAVAGMWLAGFGVASTVWVYGYYQWIITQYNHRDRNGSLISYDYGGDR